MKARWEGGGVISVKGFGVYHRAERKLSLKGSSDRADRFESFAVCGTVLTQISETGFWPIVTYQGSCSR